jgi:hypothetical protein
MTHVSLATRSAKTFFVAVLTLSAAGASAVQRYRVTDLGTPVGSSSIVAAVNDRGWTTGKADLRFTRRPLLPGIHQQGHGDQGI